MIFKQYYLPSLSHASYLLGDAGSGTAIVVDPQRDTDHYLHDAECEHLTIRYVFLTHFHDDFVAGHLELHEQTGATICLGAAAQADYSFQTFANGDELTCGTLRVQVLETPGHTPESISLLVFDLARSSDRPYAIFTGDTLLNGDVGRPDLLPSHTMSSQALAATLYDSLHQKILLLPDETPVYPAHGQGAHCATFVHPELSSTVGTQKRTNLALQAPTQDAFIERITAHHPESLPYWSYDTGLNARYRSQLAEVFNHALKPLTLDQVLRWKTARAQMLDVRNPEDFAKGHLVDSLNIGLNGKFERWAGTMLHPDTPILLITAPGQAREAVLRLARIGLDHIVGYLKHGTLSLKGTPELIRTVNRITCEELEDHLLSASPPYIVDIRTREEWAERRIEHSVNIPLNHLLDRLQEIPTDREVVVYCSSGYRSSIATSLLRRHDFCQVKDLAGGFEAWEHRVMNPIGDAADISSQAGGR